MELTLHVLLALTFTEEMQSQNQFCMTWKEQRAIQEGLWQFAYWAGGKQTQYLYPKDFRAACWINWYWNNFLCLFPSLRKLELISSFLAIRLYAELGLCACFTCSLLFYSFKYNIKNNLKCIFRLSIVVKRNSCFVYNNL